MIDIRLLRKDPETAKAALARRSPDFPPLIDAILTCDTKRREEETALQELQAERNRLSKEIGMLRRGGKESSLIEHKVKTINTEMKEREELVRQLQLEQSELLLRVPNLPDPSIPTGADETANRVIAHWGEPKPRSKETTTEAPTEDHQKIAKRLHLLDFERATKISGSGFACFTGRGARLERALINFLLDLQTEKHGYEEKDLPYLVRRECMEGTGQIPKLEDDMYGLDDRQAYLIPTAEVSLTNLYREEILPLASLPLKMTAATPCFRRESGSAGHDTRGLIRMHQFHKVELVKIVTPEQAEQELQKLLHDAEKVLQLLELPYRTLELCSGDIGFSASKTYDLEVWAPGQGGYLEVSSCSHFGDFQARRMNLRYKGEDGKNHFCHTLNGSGTALPRLFVALLENHTEPGGPLYLPQVLHPYFGASQIS